MFNLYYTIIISNTHYTFLCYFVSFFLLKRQKKTGRLPLCGYNSHCFLSLNCKKQFTVLQMKKALFVVLHTFAVGAVLCATTTGLGVAMGFGFWKGIEMSSRHCLRQCVECNNGVKKIEF